MGQIVIYFWQMCLLRVGPQKLPRSVPILAFIFVVYFLIAAFTIGLTRPGQDLFGILGGAMFGVIMEAGILWLLLLYKNVTWRFVATMSALLGTNAIILLILLPMNLILINVDAESTIRFLTEIASLLCLGWWLAIAGSILHHAINISILQGAAIIFVMELVTVVATRAIFPVS
ncbi:MAG: hypothetical protein HUJ31_15400 [Pseudomonadales bacterium]|nr:hypothetical protein [Pseudomonadales bacterium]